MKRSPLQRYTPLQSSAKPKRQKLKAARGGVSSLGQTYLQVVTDYLSRNPVCHVGLELNLPAHRANQVHHIAGRDSTRLTDTRLFMAVCQHCHTIDRGSIHENPERAYHMGWLLSRHRTHAQQVQDNLDNRGKLSYVRREYETKLVSEQINSPDLLAE